MAAAALCPIVRLLFIGQMRTDPDLNSGYTVQ